MMASLEQNRDDPSSTPVVRIKLPWSAVVSAMGAVAVVLIVMWSSVAKLTDEVRDLKTAVQVGNSLVTDIQVRVGQMGVTVGDTKARLDHHLDGGPSRR